MYGRSIGKVSFVDTLYMLSYILICNLSLLLDISIESADASSPPSLSTNVVISYKIFNGFTYVRVLLNNSINSFSNFMPQEILLYNLLCFKFLVLAF